MEDNNLSIEEREIESKVLVIKSINYDIMQKTASVQLNTQYSSEFPENYTMIHISVDVRMAGDTNIEEYINRKARDVLLAGMIALNHKQHDINDKLQT